MRLTRYKAFESFRSLLLLLCLALTWACCGSHEHRYFAEIATQDEGKTSAGEITFNLELSECVNGFEERGFAWRTLKVANPTVDNVPLTEHTDDGHVFYTLQGKPNTYDFTFELDGRKYFSDSNSVAVFGTNIRWQMKEMKASE